MYTLQVSDVKRVWSLRQSLLLMDFEDNSSESLKQLLHQCMIHPVYLWKTSSTSFKDFILSVYDNATQTKGNLVRSVFVPPDRQSDL